MKGTLLAPFSREYQISDWAETGTITYVLKETVDGRWYIMKVDESNGSVRYAVGSANAQTAWAGRAGLNYDTFAAVFQD